MAESRRAWLSLGSNLGDSPGLIEEAVGRVGALPGTALLAASRLYRTAPWGEPDQPDFLNAAIAIDTTLSPWALLASCLAIEDALGRVRTRRWGPRRIDIDVIHIEGVVLVADNLILPHPRWRERAFVLAPLAEIAPDLAIDGVPVEEALAALDTADICPRSPAADSGSDI